MGPLKLRLSYPPISTDDFLYDLFYRNEIDLDATLEKEDANRVRQAIETILQFRTQLREWELWQNN